MTITLLLDLDETLLDTNLGAFVPAYYQKLATHLAPHVPPESLLKYLMLGTRQMMASEDPSRTLREVFDENFYPFLKMDHDAVQPAI